MEYITYYLRTAAAVSEEAFWADKFKSSYGMDVEFEPNLKDHSILLRTTYNYLSQMPMALVRACKVNKLIFSDLGKSRAYSPNHGFYVPTMGTVTMNAQMYYDPDQPDDFTDDKGNFMSRVNQTLVHEFAHALDHNLGDISLQEPWLRLSGWSKEMEPGLKRLIIKEPGAPEIIGEWWYNPECDTPEHPGFTRFYAKRNPFDDFADSIAYYLNLKSKVPDVKRGYLDKLLAPYYKK